MQMNRLSNSDFDKMIIESIDDVSAYNRATGELIFMFDQIISGEITSESETVYAEGRQGIQLAAFDRNKTAGFTCENGYVQAGAVATQLGTEVSKADAQSKIEGFVGDGTTKNYVIDKEATINRVEVKGVVKAAETDYTYTSATGVIAFSTTPGNGENITVYYTTKSNTIILDVTEIVEIKGNENTITLRDEVRLINNIPQVKYVYKLAADGSKSKTYTYGTNASATQFSVADKVVTLPTGSYAEGDKFLVQYEATTTHGQEIINAGDKYSSNVKLVINFVAQEPCGGNKYLMQCVMPNAKVSGTFSLSVGDSPAVQNFEASALLDVCSVDKELFVIKMV